MTRRLPQDRAFNRVVLQEIEMTSMNERLIFIDTNNTIREVLHPSAFESGDHLLIRERLEKLGVLKAVVHISATIFGSPSGHGPRTTTVEYLPTKQYFAVEFQPPISRRPTDDAAEEAVQTTKQLWKQSGKEKAPKSDS